MSEFKYEIDGVTVELSRCHDDGHGNALVDYEVSDDQWDGPNPVFSGSDFKPSAMHDPFSEQAALALLTFFTLQIGDTDREYFDKDTPEQARWRASRGAVLQIAVEDELEKLE